MATPTRPLIHPMTQKEILHTQLLFGVEENDSNRIKDNLNTIMEWCQKQDHLKKACKYLNIIMLERFYVISKGSIEVTKQRIDKFLTSRGLMPELVQGRTIEEFESLWNCVLYIPLPRLCSTDQSRVMITQFTKEMLDEFTLLGYFRYGFMIGEYRTNFDYALAERYVVDFTNVKMSILSKLNPLVIKKAEIMCTEIIGIKIKGIHILNAPPFVDKIVYILKQAFKEKVGQRIHVHSTYEDLHKHIPKEILPKDYGGDEETCSVLSRRWKDALRSEEARRIIRENERLVSDETYRQSLKFNEEYMGMPGSFRKLAVD